MIEVVFSIHDADGNYNMVLGVAIYSLLLNTSSDVRVHIIHDNTVTQAIKERLKKIVQGFGQKIDFHMVDVSTWNISEEVYKISTIGTMLRLAIPDIFVGYDKLLYLDADIIVNLDVSELWEKEINEYYVGACRDNILGKIKDGSPIIRDGLVKGEEYFNGGVLLMNLRRIRELGDFFQICTDFFSSNQECRFADQDVMNVIFRGHVLYLQEKYNYFTIDMRCTGEVLQEAIYHFAGDKACLSEMQKYDWMYFEYLLCTPNSNEYFLNAVQDKIVATEKSVKLYQKLNYDIENGKNLIIWGVKGVLFERLLEFLPIKSIAYMVDSNHELWNESINSIKVRSPQQLFDDNKAICTVIVISLRHYNDIANILAEHGMLENIDFIDGRKLLLETQGGYNI